jgi:hypothetical protein
MLQEEEQFYNVITQCELNKKKFDKQWWTYMGITTPSGNPFIISWFSFIFQKRRRWKPIEMAMSLHSFLFCFSSYRSIRHAPKKLNSRCVSVWGAGLWWHDLVRLSAKNRPSHGGRENFLFNLNNHFSVYLWWTCGRLKSLTFFIYIFLHDLTNANEFSHSRNWIRGVVE